MHWSQVSADILYPDHPTDPSEVLANVTGAKDASAALESYNPQHKLYKELKAKLAELRGQGDGPMIHIAEGPALENDCEPVSGPGASASSRTGSGTESVATVPPPRLSMTSSCPPAL